MAKTLPPYRQELWAVGGLLTMINRRHFLGGLAALVGGVVLEQAIPFNRVWSFPKQIVIAQYSDFVNISDLAEETAIDPQIFRYVYRNHKGEILSPEIVVTGREAQIMRGLIGKTRRFDHDLLDIVAVPVE